MKRKKFVIDGSKVKDLNSFYTEAGKVLCPNFKWGRNLDAFNDILRGGFGSFEYEEPIELVWKHSEKSREYLGYPETIREFRKWLFLAYLHFNFSDAKGIKEKLRRAKQEIGLTLFDQIIEIINYNTHIHFILD